MIRGDQETTDTKIKLKLNSFDIPTTCRKTSETNGFRTTNRTRETWNVVVKAIFMIIKTEPSQIERCEKYVPYAEKVAYNIGGIIEA